MKKMIVSLLLASLVGASVMTGCASGTQQGSTSAAPAAEESGKEAEAQDSATADAAAQAAEDAASAEAAQTEADQAETAQTAATAETAADRAQALPAFRYTGEDPCGEAVCLYLRDTFAADYDPADVMIPSIDILEEDLSDPEDCKVWGNFWIMNYSLEGSTLMMESGGQYPGLMHLKKTDDGYEVTSMDLVKDGSEYSTSVEEIFGAREGLADRFRTSCESENQEEARAALLRMYVQDTGLEVTAYQDYGWDPVPLFEAEAEAESDGQNPVMNYIGDYACGRAAVHIECDGTEGAKISISWSDSAAEHDEWEMTGTFDAETKTVSYDNCVCKHITYKSADDENPDVITVYENGKGTITFAEDGSLSLTWQDEEQHCADDMVFEYASYGGAEEDSADQ